MIRIFNRLGFCLLYCAVLVNTAFAELVSADDVACSVDEVVFEGLHRTDKVWLLDYMGIYTPQVMSRAALPDLRRHIMTTDIFVDVEPILEDTRPGFCRLKVQITEKWTLIPVVRGAYGGGTPLVVAGAYETNAFGKLYALGAEIRRYGNMAPGLFMFAKSPRAWRGRGSFGGELWLDRRRRGFFDTDHKIYGYADSEAWTGKFQILYPVGASWPALQAGVHTEVIRERPTTFADKDLNANQALAPKDIEFPNITASSMTLLPMLVYDRVDVDRMTMDGTRAVFKAGAQLTEAATASASEVEVFHYYSFNQVWNAALHGFAGSQSSRTLRSQYFLGGFDSVRGLPDGIHYGQKMLYANFELRHLSLVTKYLHVQSAVFMDEGTAFNKTEDMVGHREVAAGLGVRLSVPQVYRLLLRIDYGWSMGQSKSKGLSIGLGQFFQPYRLFF